MERLDELDPEHAAAVSADALRLMAELNVPLIPTNFTVWFAYALGRSDALRKTIDAGQVRRQYIFALAGPLIGWVVLCGVLGKPGLLVMVPWSVGRSFICLGFPLRSSYTALIAR